MDTPSGFSFREDGRTCQNLSHLEDVILPRNADCTHYGIYVIQPLVPVFQRHDIQFNVYRFLFVTVFPEFVNDSFCSLHHYRSRCQQVTVCV